ncbi:SpoIID/LytB domain-containing protein [Bacillaceae bacterium IKA-2]|nr:SpoIID/LytB domain-containing protein [Bacillaceae bacterium IKA-2]
MRKLVKVASLTLMIAFLLNYLPAEVQQNLFKNNSEVNAVELLSNANERLMQVRLKNYLGDKTTIPIKFTGNYQVFEDAKIVLEANKEYQIKLSGGKLQLFDGSTLLKTFTSVFTLIPERYYEDNYMAEYIFIDKRAYLGQIQFTVENSKFIRPINTLRLEDYLKSVVPHEMPAWWGNATGGMEALKSQAVAARGYAVRRSSTIIDDTTLFQVYGGFKNSNTNVWHPNTTQAVNETNGEVLLTGLNIADTVYSSSNGGVVESNFGAWNSRQLPYLKAKADPFDPKHSWNFTVQKQQIQVGNLANPSSWWNSTNEQNANLTNRLKQSLTALDSYKGTNSIKVNSIDLISFANMIDGERYKNASFDLSFYVKDKDAVNVKELQGQTRWDTNKEITQFGWTKQQDVVLIGRGDQSADALTGNVLAAKYNAPILLTKNDQLPSQMVDELTRLKPSTIYILGGPLAISAGVEKKIKELAPTAKIQRIAGKTRYATSVDIAKEINSSSKSIILAPTIDGNGNESPDALTIGPYAGVNQIPILLTEKDDLRSEIRNYITDNAINQVYIIGGDLVVSNKVEAELRKLANVKVERIAGKTRFETSIKITERFPLNSSKVFFARGDGHIDALAAAPMAAREKAPIVLTRTTSLPNEVRDWLIKEKNNVKDVYFLGGQLAIEDGTREAIKNSLMYRLNNDGTVKLFNEQVTITTAQLRLVIGGSVMKSTLINANTPSLSNGVYTVRGSGFGHGVGMSQYGAYERAKAGQTYQQILGFYYDDTTIGTR